MITFKTNLDLEVIVDFTLGHNGSGGIQRVYFKDDATKTDISTLLPEEIQMDLDEMGAERAYEDGQGTMDNGVLVPAQEEE